MAKSLRDGEMISLFETRVRDSSDVGLSDVDQVASALERF